MTSSIDTAAVLCPGPSLHDHHIIDNGTRFAVNAVGCNESVNPDVWVLRDYSGFAEYARDAVCDQLSVCHAWKQVMYDGVDHHAIPNAPSNRFHHDYIRLRALFKKFDKWWIPDGNELSMQTDLGHTIPLVNRTSLTAIVSAVFFGATELHIYGWDLEGPPHDEEHWMNERTWGKKLLNDLSDREIDVTVHGGWFSDFTD
jgi:hypothetical protein